MSVCMCPPTNIENNKKGWSVGTSCVVFHCDSECHTVECKGYVYSVVKHGLHVQEVAGDAIVARSRGLVAGEDDRPPLVCLHKCSKKRSDIG